MPLSFFHASNNNASSLSSATSISARWKKKKKWWTFGFTKDNESQVRDGRKCLTQVERTKEASDLAICLQPKCRTAPLFQCVFLCCCNSIQKLEFLHRVSSRSPVWDNKSTFLQCSQLHFRLLLLYHRLERTNK